MAQLVPPQSYASQRTCHQFDAPGIGANLAGPPQNGHRFTLPCNSLNFSTFMADPLGEVASRQQSVLDAA